MLCRFPIRIAFVLLLQQRFFRFGILGLFILLDELFEVAALGTDGIERDGKADD